MEEPIEQEIKREPHPLDIKPKPPLGKRLNKRLLGCAILVLGTVLAAIVFGINRRSAANAVVQTKGGTATTETVQAIPKTEAKTLISNLQKPTANATTPATASQAQPSGPANPPPADPSSLNKQPWQPVSGMRDTGFQRSFLQPSQTPSQSQQRRPETPAQEAARLEHEALYAPLTAKKQDAPKSGVPATSPETPIPGMPASSDIEQIASLAKSLIPSTQGAAQAAPDLSRLGGRGATPATFAEAARRHAEDDSLANLRTGPLSPFEIKAGWEIPAMLEQGLKSELPGELRALVTQNVRDTASGKHLLIPQGSRLIGTYNDKTTFGQGGVEVIWTRIIFPDASSLDLDGMIGQDERGQAGLRGKTDNHYGQLVGTALLTSVLSATASLANNRSGSGIGYYPSWQQAAGAGAAQSIQETGSQLTQRTLNRRPTVFVPAGTRFNVHVNKDIRFDGAYAPRQALMPAG